MSRYDDVIVEALADFRLPDFSKEDEDSVIRFFNTREFTEGQAFVNRFGAAVTKKSGGAVTLRVLKPNAAWILGVAAYLRLEENGKRLDFLVSPAIPPFQTKESLGQ